MSARNLLYMQFGFAALLGFIHVSAIAFYLYWQLPWLDLLTHFLGGAYVATFSMWVVVIAGRTPRFMPILAAAIAFGAGWELFEFMIGSPRDDTFLIDTTLDFLMDGAGAVFALVTAFRK